MPTLQEKVKENILRTESDTGKLMREIDDILADQVITGEVLISEANRQPIIDEFEECVDLLDAQRREKNYDWNSDISIPEFASHHLTQSSIDAGQYFQSRDFVTAYLEDESEVAKANAAAATELINRTLNQKYLHHYLKFVRAKGINNIVGHVYAKCWWEQETIEEPITITRYEQMDIDDYGEPLTSPEQVPAIREVSEVIPQQKAVIDRFNYDIWDERNVWMDGSYTYSLQDKRWVTFGSEMTLSELRENEDKNGYFNLDKLEEIDPPSETQFKSRGQNKYDREEPVTSAVERPYDIYERYGKFWYLKGKPGIGIDGKPKKNAQLLECIITVAASNDQKVLIGFKPTPFLDAYQKPYRPLLRGLCYVNLVRDSGTGDGKYSKELQVAIDDTFNISQDRVMLATLPTFTTDKLAEQDNSEIYFEPGHHIPLTDPKGGIYEFKVSDNIQGALQQIGMLTQKMQQVDSIQPPQMGDVGQASTTATAFAGAFRATGERANYKSMTFENTFLVDLYWMIQQMTFSFAMPETGFQLMGEKIYDFDPSKDYYYKPVSQTIEPEYSKAAKRKEWSTIIGYAAQIPHEDTVKLLNYAFAQFIKLMGDEYQDFADKLLDESKPIQNEGGTEMVAGQTGMAPSNQNMIPQSTAETDARGIANVGIF